MTEEMREPEIDEGKELWRELLPERIFVVAMTVLMPVLAVVAVVCMIVNIVRGNWSVVVTMVILEIGVALFYLYPYRTALKLIRAVRQLIDEPNEPTVDR